MRLRAVGSWENNLSDSYAFFVGIDLGSESHCARLLDHQGRSIGELTFEHGGQAMRKFLDWLIQNTAAADRSAVAAAVEAPRGAVIDVLLEAGFAVFSINPKQLDRFRDRFSVAGAKDDRRDALVLADSLRTDQPHFRQLHPDDPRLIRLRELSRAEDVVRDDLRCQCNRLWSDLQRYFPALLTLCAAADEPWLWDLLQRTGAIPERLARLRLSSLESLLRKHRVRRVSAEQLRQAGDHPLPLAPGVAEAVAEQVLLLLPRLQLLHQQRAQLSRRIEDLIEELTEDESFGQHRDIAILRSLPGVGRVCTATMLAEAFTPFKNRDYHGLRALAGIAPVTQQSGKTRIVAMRRACNSRLRHALFHAAAVHMTLDPQAKQIYTRLRQRGKSHGRAVRGVSDRLLDLLFVLLRKDTLYEAERRKPPAVAAA